MPEMSEEQQVAVGAGRPKRRLSRGAIVGIGIAVAVVIGFAALTVWALGRSSGTPGGFAEQQSAWSSAMAKAGVEATYPAGPVDVTKVRATGSHPFSATFTAEEVSALLAVYRFSTESAGAKVGLKRAQVGFPEAGVAQIDATMRVDDSSYSAKALAPVVFENGRVRLSKSGAEASVEGFKLKGGQLGQLVSVTESYLNDFIAAAPGLRIESARIVNGGIEMTGTAPTRIENPSPIPE